MSHAVSCSQSVGLPRQTKQPVGTSFFKPFRSWLLPRALVPCATICGRALQRSRYQSVRTDWRTANWSPIELISSFTSMTLGSTLRSKNRQRITRSKWYAISCLGWRGTVAVWSERPWVHVCIMKKRSARVNFYCVCTNNRMKGVQTLFAQVFQRRLCSFETSHESPG